MAEKGSPPLNWRDCTSFVEVKGSVDDAPHPDDSHTGSPKDSLVQAVDYCRSILDCRPFMLHVYGIILCGYKFCLVYVDRYGVILSPHSSFRDRGTGDEPDGLSQFIRIILRLMWDASDHELGMDPNVTNSGKRTDFDGQKYPRLTVSMTTPEGPSTWNTLGPPLWTSHTLFGRGTSVWRVTKSHKPPSILKVAWSTTNRKPERDIYASIQSLIEKAGGESIPGMVNCHTVEGGDVFYPDDPTVPINVSSLRPKGTQPCPEQPPQLVYPDLHLHRVVFHDVGKPLWRFNGHPQLVRAMKMALEAHEKLCELGVLHRDISPGNIMIRMNVSRHENQIQELEKDVELTEGFLTDFELAEGPWSDDTPKRNDIVTVSDS
ncbi:hypothetical protein BD309DRAFT_994414 [Dichomitus squalens]|nr:hypothetical protein BD309DRAFT_994414 [Dichomitus squalens]